jgi:hypothetical protein
MWGKEALQHCKCGTVGNSGEDSEGQIADRKADTKLCYKVHMGTRTLLGTGLHAMRMTICKELKYILSIP